MSHFITLLPYLKTSESIKYRNLTLRSIKDRESLASKESEHLAIIGEMFFLKDHFQIQDMSYLMINGENDSIFQSQQQQTKEFQSILAYLYSSPHRVFGDPFLHYEHASCFSFKPDLLFNSLIKEKHNVISILKNMYPEPDEHGRVEGYRVFLNQKERLWVTKGSRIYPPVPGLWLNISQDIFRDLDRKSSNSSNLSILDFFTAEPTNMGLRKRILTALDWYNRSNSLGIDQDLALLNLAVAFESLLGLDQRRQITERFMEAINLLLGGFPRLESWLIQFYDARSQIVHKGGTAALLFKAIDDPSKKNKSDLSSYRSLVSDGRLVFRACLNTIMGGAIIANEIGLPSMLYTNQQRYEKICQILDETEEDPESKLRDIHEYVSDIDKYKFVAEEGLRVKTLIGATSRVAKIYLETDPTDIPELNHLINESTGIDNGEDVYESLDAIRKLVEYIEGGLLRNRQPGSILDTVCMLIESVWHYTFMHFYWLKEERKEEGN